MDNKNALMTRRAAMKQAAVLMGSAATVASFGPFISRAAIAAAENSPPLFFNTDQFNLLQRLVDVMIPQTDTPGAHAAGVHHFIDLMLSEWASTDRQVRYTDGLQKLHTQLQTDSGESFVSSSPEQQLERLTALDETAYAEDSSDDFYREFKKLVLFGYYSSEAGATVELQYEPMQADYKACVPIEDIGRTWFWLGFSHGL